MKMSSTSAATSNRDVKKIGKVCYERQKSEDTSPEDSYGDESFDEFQEDVRNVLDSSDSEDTYQKESSADNSHSEEHKHVQRDTSELQLIIDTLQKNTKRACSKTRGYNKTFSDDELRDIERGNSILMRKILSNSHRTSQYNDTSCNGKVWNSTVNRKKRQQEIDQHNLVLLKRIQAVKPFGLSQRK